MKSDSLEQNISWFLKLMSHFTINLWSKSQRFEKTPIKSRLVCVSVVSPSPGTFWSSPVDIDKRNFLCHSLVFSKLRSPVTHRPTSSHIFKWMMNEWWYIFKKHKLFNGWARLQSLPRASFFFPGLLQWSYFDASPFVFCSTISFSVCSFVCIWWLIILFIRSIITFLLVVQWHSYLKLLW